LKVSRRVAAGRASDFECDASLEKELGELKDAAQYVMDLYVRRRRELNPGR
jgi:hypothetical protein